MSWQSDWVKRFYRSRPGWEDGTVEMHALCAANVPRGGRILEIGSGPSNPTTAFLAGLGEVHGLDLDPDVTRNAALASASVFDGGRFPFEDASFDACVSNFVLEHVEHPRAHLHEVRRVLRPGGAYVFRTPNLTHYVSLASRATPHRVHVAIANRLRALPAGAHDPYPTFYRLNTRRAIRRAASAAALGVDELRVIEKEPSYGMSSRALFLAFMAYERAVNATDLLQDLRSTILGVLRRAD